MDPRGDKKVIPQKRGILGHIGVFWEYRREFCVTGIAEWGCTRISQPRGRRFESRSPRGGRPRSIIINQRERSKKWGKTMKKVKSRKRSKKVQRPQNQFFIENPPSPSSTGTMPSSQAKPKIEKPKNGKILLFFRVLLSKWVINSPIR